MINTQLPIRQAHTNRTALLFIYLFLRPHIFTKSGCICKNSWFWWGSLWNTVNYRTASQQKRACYLYTVSQRWTRITLHDIYHQTITKPERHLLKYNYSHEQVYGFQSWRCYFSLASSSLCHLTLNLWRWLKASCAHFHSLFTGASDVGLYMT